MVLYLALRQGVGCLKPLPRNSICMEARGALNSLLAPALLTSLHYFQTSLRASTVWERHTRMSCTSNIFSWLVEDMFRPHGWSSTTAPPSPLPPPASLSDSTTPPGQGQDLPLSAPSVWWGASGPPDGTRRLSGGSRRREGDIFPVKTSPQRSTAT